MAEDDKEFEQYGIWSAYGLKGNPFSPDPLPVFGGEVSIEAFFGREKEISQIQRIIYSNSQSRILVNGNIGIGKTTFVNHIRAAAFKRGYFTTLAEIGIQHDWTAEEFMHVTLSAVFTSINRIRGVREKFDQKFLEKLDIYFGTNRGFSQGISGGMAGISAGRETGRAYDSPTLNAFTLKDVLNETIENLKKAGYKGLIVHYNNLELLNDRDDRNITKLFNGIRDFLQTEGAHFIFVGDLTVADILQKVPRVDDIFYGPPIHMEPFSEEETCRILETRLDQLRIKGQITMEKPYGDEAIAILYKLFSGNIRAIFKSLTTAITYLASENKPVILQPKNMAIALRRIAEERYLIRLNQTEKNVLLQIMTKKETTNKLISETLKMRPQNVSNAITKLRQYNCIRLSRVEGRARYYVPAPEIRWLLFRVSTDGQTDLPQYAD